MLQLRQIFLKLNSGAEASSRVLEIGKVPLLLRLLPEQVAGVKIAMNYESGVHAGNKLSQFHHLFFGAIGLPVGAHLVVGHAIGYEAGNEPDFYFAILFRKSYGDRFRNADAFLVERLQNVPLFLRSGESPLPLQLLDKVREGESLHELVVKTIDEAMVAAALK